MAITDQLPASDRADALAAHREPGAEVLSATGIEKSYRHRPWPLPGHRQQVLRGAGLSLRTGEVVGLVGENGSGKSTLMKILVGALAPDAGTVSRAGRLGYCPQQPLVYARLTCSCSPRPGLVTPADLYQLSEPRRSHRDGHSFPAAAGGPRPERAFR